MSLRKQIILGLVSLAGISAHAEGQSEFFYQTAAGKSAFSIQGGNVDRSLKTTYDNGSATAQNYKEQGLTSTGIRYEMGISDMFSMEAVVTGSNVNTTPDDPNQLKGSISGLDDVQLNFKGTMAMGFGRIRYGAMNRIGLSEAHYGSRGNGDHAANTSTSGTGSYTFTPYIGADMDLGGGNLGIRFSYDLLKHDILYHNPGDGFAYYTGGQKADLNVFYEMYLGTNNLIGLALDLTNVKSSSLSGDAQQGYTTYGGTLYGRVGLSESWSLIPKVGYDIYASKYAVDSTNEGHYISSGNTMTETLAVRYAF